jgi:mannose-6-phosphate isomerase-like protein (cupin superfamily)
LLERIAQVDKPIIASTAGSSLEDIDKVASFLRHRDKNFALMHCVAEYPTADEHLDLGQIDLLRNRYEDVPIGYSTHERPNNFDSIQIAIAKGATIFEKHVGIATDQMALNEYSATPEQVRRWLESAEHAFRMCGVGDQRRSFSESELSSLASLRRAAFAARPLRKNEKISLADVFFALPGEPDQLAANDFSKYVDFYTLADVDAEAPLLTTQVRRVDRRQKIFGIVQKVKALIRDAGIIVPGQADFEISHHYGVDRFEEVGATLISFVNRAYCKKLIVLLPGQRHPEHWHEVKEETFVVVSGDVTITLNGTARQFGPGDIILVERGVRHSFYSGRGAAIEELSSTHYGNDSYYTDPSVPAGKDRKTLVTYWLDIRAADTGKSAVAGR